MKTARRAAAATLVLLAGKKITEYVIYVVLMYHWHKGDCGATRKQAFCRAVSVTARSVGSGQLVPWSVRENRLIA